MKKNYLTPGLSVMEVKTEAGFAVSDAGYGLGTPGSDIGYDEYGNEL